ncbi:MAG: PQQ-binding-like beta-propeller repeat protein [Planctomycetia bacterium]|nr:PQQ-binding-like beta-propeller repeat protein [Planctomycetia bacterium]
MTRLVALAIVILLFCLALGDVGFRLPIWPRGDGSVDVAPPESSTNTGPGWPNRRGPNQDAISNERGVAERWPDEGPPVLWAREIGCGYSGFTAVGSRVYTQTQTLTAQNVVCLDADTGEPLWEHRYGWPYEPGGMYPGPRATPAWNAGRVYFAGPSGLVGCLRAYDGQPLWQVDVNEQFAGRGTDFGYACSPVIEDGKVILPVGGEGASVVALDALDGSTVWTSGSEPASYCSVLPITFRGRRCVVAFLENVLGVFDPKTGRLLCQTVCSSGYDEHAASPLYDEPFLMIARPFQSGAECYRLTVKQPDVDALRKDGKDAAAASGLSLEPAWDTRKLSNDTASSVLFEGHVYGFDIRDAQAKSHRPSRGTFKCLDFATGKVLWETDEVGHATVVVADGKLILFNDRGELILARATPDRYAELARTAVFNGEICWTAPALHRGRLYLRSPTRAACVYIGDPEGLDAGQRRSARPASATVPPSRIDLTRLVGGERPYAFDPADARELGQWFAFSLLGVFAPAAVLAMAAGYVADKHSRQTTSFASPRVAWGVFWGAAFVLGVAGTPVFNRVTGSFIFTWPVCLFVAHQVALNTIVRSDRRSDGDSPRRGQSWAAMAATLLLVGTCLAYFLVCRRLSLATEWTFLLGFIPSWPLALPAANRFRRGIRSWEGLLWTLFGFAAFFWSAGAILIWRVHYLSAAAMVR